MLAVLSSEQDIIVFSVDVLSLPVRVMHKFLYGPLQGDAVLSFLGLLISVLFLVGLIIFPTSPQENFPRSFTVRLISISALAFTLMVQIP